MIRIDVQGAPVPQGSMSAIPFHRPCPKCLPGKPCGRTRMCVGGREIGANVTHDKADELKVWRDMIALQASVSLNCAGVRGRPMIATGGVTLGVIFWLQRPQGHYTSKGILSADGERNPDPWHKPDEDKLQRGVRDALTGVVYTDDSQVTRVLGAKAWTPRRQPPGVSILVDTGPGFARMAALLDDLVTARIGQATGDLFA